MVQPAPEDRAPTAERRYDVAAPLRRAPAGRPGPTQVNRDTTSFIGRTRELTDLEHLVSRARLVTLTGTGGIGKTRLALRLGERVGARFPGGIVFVPLATVSTAERVAEAVARQFGLPDAGRSTLEYGIAQIRCGAPEHRDEGVDTPNQFVSGAEQQWLPPTLGHAAQIVGYPSQELPPSSDVERSADLAGSRVTSVRESNWYATAYSHFQRHAVQGSRSLERSDGASTRRE